MFIISTKGQFKRFKCSLNFYIKKFNGNYFYFNNLKINMKDSVFRLKLLSLSYILNLKIWL